MNYHVRLGPEQSCTSGGPWLLNVPLTSMDTYMGQTDGIQRDSRCTDRKNWVLGKKKADIVTATLPLTRQCPNPPTYAVKAICG